MASLASWLHERQLKLGVYTDIGNKSCGAGPGSYGHYESDARTFAAWQIDALKVDFCDFWFIPQQLEMWQSLRDALNNTGRPIWLYTSPHSGGPQTKVPATGVTAPWRDSHPYSPPLEWSSETIRGLSNSMMFQFVNLFDYWYGEHWGAATSPPAGFITNVDAIVALSKRDGESISGPGFWVDAQQLEVCNFGEGNEFVGSYTGGMTLEEYRAQYSIWAMMASPMVLSFDVRSVAARHAACLEMVKNTELLDIAMDKLGVVGRLLHQLTNLTSGAPASDIRSHNIVEQIWTRELSGGAVAVCLFNRDEYARNMSVMWAAAAPKLRQPLTVRNIWSKIGHGAELDGTFGEGFWATVPKHSVVMLRVEARTQADAPRVKSDDTPSDPVDPWRRTKLAAYLRRVNGWVAGANVAENNLTCQSAGPDCGVTDYIFINGNMARGLMAGHAALRNQTELDLGLQWCDTFVALAYNTTASDGTQVKYWDSGYRSLFFGDTGTALQAVATGYLRASDGSGGSALARARQEAYLEAMLGYYNYVAKGCVQPPQIPGFAYGNSTPPAGRGWLIEYGPGAGAIGDGYCPPKHTGGLCFAPYSCATGTTAAGAFGALASLLAAEAHPAAHEVAKVAAAAGEFIAAEISGGVLTDWNYDDTNATAGLAGSGWIPQHWIAYPFGEGLVQAALADPGAAIRFVTRTAPLVAYLCRSQHPDGYWGLNKTADTPDLRRGVRVVTFLQWHYSVRPAPEVAAAIARFADFLLSDPLWYGVAYDGPDTLKDVGPGLVTGFVSLDVADLLSFGSSFVATAPIQTAAAAASKTFYVDSEHGNDGANGLSPASAWRSLRKACAAVLQPGDSMLFARGSVWRGQLRVQTGNATHTTVYGAFGDGALPKPLFLGSLSASAESDWVQAQPGSHTWVMGSVGNKYAAIMDRDMQSYEDFDLRDIGNLILDGEKSVGWRVWALDELTQQDHWYYAASINSHLRGRNETKLYFYSPAGNPAVVHKTIECGWINFAQADLIGFNGVNHVIVESLAVKYTGSSAIGGGNVSQFVLRHCDVSWAGGACIEPGPRFKRNPLECTRYGNGFDIWEWSNNVEIHSNRMWECYDTGFTNQGTSGNYTERNISYHHNIVAHAEYCFEVWDQNHPAPRNASSMSEIRIEQNVCVDSGGGWSHAQRPDPSGRHICMFSNTASVSNVSILNNIFYQTVPYQAGWYMWDRWGCPGFGCGSGPKIGWGDSIREDGNVWWQSEADLGMIIMLGARASAGGAQSYSAVNFSAYREFTRNGAHSLQIDPMMTGLMNGSKLSDSTDMRLAIASPVIGRGQPTIWTEDFAGASVPSGRPDIGAFQHKQASQVFEGSIVDQ